MYPSKLQVLRVEEFKRLYFDEGMKMNKIAARYKVSVTGLYRWFHRHKGDFPLGLQGRRGNK